MHVFSIHFIFVHCMCVCVGACVQNLNIGISATLCVFVQLFLFKHAAVCVCACMCMTPSMQCGYDGPFWMIDVLERAARSSGWARASVWHTAASLLLYICRHSKTPPPLPSDTANSHRFLLGFYSEACVFHETKPSTVLLSTLATSCFTFYIWELPNTIPVWGARG